MSRLQVSTESIIEGILQYNSDNPIITTAGLRQWCNSTGYNYQTIYNRLKDYKAGRGKFNLTKAQAVQQLENTYEAPSTPNEVAVIHQEYQSLVPQSDPLFVPFGNFTDVKRMTLAK